MSTRIDLIKKWLVDLKCTVKSLQPASSDASFRSYLRVVFSQSASQQFSTDKSYIIMDAPPEHEDIQPFLYIADFMYKQGLNVPQIYAVNKENGFILLSDLGSISYLDQLTAENADELYKQAMHSLLTLQSIKKDQWIKLPDYDSDLLNREMDLFEQWYIKVHLRISLEHSQQQVLKQTLAFLTEQVLQQPRVIVHRDYHSRNLMYLQENNPGIIDFQDAVIGSCCYDLVSLLRDSYIAWPEQQVESWVGYFHQHLMAQNIIDSCSFSTFMQWFDFMSMQRQIKVVGIFSRLYHRDGKENYLNDIPQTLAYLTATSHKYPELKEFNQLLIKLQSFNKSH